MKQKPILEEEEATHNSKSSSEAGELMMVLLDLESLKKENDMNNDTNDETYIRHHLEELIERSGRRETQQEMNDSFGRH